MITLDIKTKKKWFIIQWEQEKSAFWKSKKGEEPLLSEFQKDKKKQITIVYTNIKLTDI